MRLKKATIFTLCFVFIAAVLLFGGGCAKNSESNGQPSIGGNLPDEEEQAAKPDSFTVTFLSDGGTEVPPQTVKRGEKAVRPKDPFKIENVNGYDVDYVFDGWFSGETEWVFEEAVVTDDITLVAHWHNEYAPPV